jgi:nicotinate-nucleotide adenylyltransferase
LRVGILGGAFNPPHLGHLVCAREAAEELELSEVVLIPFSRPPHRELEQDPGPELRLEMCELVAAADECLAASRLELDRSGRSYTVDTLRELRERRPGDELFLVMGGDQAASLCSWREPEEVLRLATVAVAQRESWDRERVLHELSGLPGVEGVVFFEMPRIDVSSTMVRRRVAEGRSIRYLVPDEVAGFIRSRSLYGATVAAQ